MIRSLVFVHILLLLTTRVAAADQASTAPAEPSQGEAPGGDKAAGTVPAPDVPDPDQLRQGLHLGFGTGGIYIPGIDVKALVLRMDFNWGIKRREHRLSPVFYYATQADNGSWGIGLADQLGFHLTPILTMSVGGVFSVHHGSPSRRDSYTTLGVAAMGSPLTLRLGAKRNTELGLQLMALGDLHYRTLNPAGYISFSYLML